MIFRSLLTLWFTLFVSACSNSSAPTLEPTSTPETTLVTPVEITAKGQPRTFSATNAGGTEFIDEAGVIATLDIPPGAVPGDREFTIQAVDSVTGTGLANISALKFGPAGALFSKPLKLRFLNPPEGIKSGFLINDENAELEILPVFNDPAGGVFILIPHFSTGGIGSGTLSVTNPYETFTALSNNNAPVEELAAELIKVYDEDVNPRLRDAVNDFTDFKSSAGGFNQWFAQVQLTAADDPVSVGAIASEINTRINQGRELMAQTLRDEAQRINQRVTASGNYLDIKPLEEIVEFARILAFDAEDQLDKASLLAQAAVKIVPTIELLKENGDVVVKGTVKLKVGDSFVVPPTLSAKIVLSGSVSDPEVPVTLTSDDGSYRIATEFDLTSLGLSAHVSAELSDLPFIFDSSPGVKMERELRVAITVRGPNQAAAVSTTAQAGDSVTVVVSVSKGDLAFGDQPVTLSLTGQGTLAATSGTTVKTGTGEFTTTLTIPNDTSGGETEITALVPTPQGVVTATAQVNIRGVSIAVHRSGQIENVTTVSPSENLLVTVTLMQGSGAVEGQPVTLEISGEGSLSQTSGTTNNAGVFSTALSIGKFFVSGETAITATVSTPTGTLTSRAKFTAVGVCVSDESACPTMICEGFCRI